MSNGCWQRVASPTGHLQWRLGFPYTTRSLLSCPAVRPSLTWFLQHISLWQWLSCSALKEPLYCSRRGPQTRGLLLTAGESVGNVRPQAPPGTCCRMWSFPVTRSPGDLSAHSSILKTCVWENTSHSPSGVFPTFLALLSSKYHDGMFLEGRDPVSFSSISNAQFDVQ